ncbi:hypothetical protein A1704_03900 [Chryseobacterium cucumeris]|nr:hypothetical protein A1704_03900 [Chryseobacterium cucumeris]
MIIITYLSLLLNRIVVTTPSKIQRIFATPPKEGNVYVFSCYIDGHEDFGNISGKESYLSNFLANIGYGEMLNVVSAKAQVILKKDCYKVQRFYLR